MLNHPVLADYPSRHAETNIPGVNEAHHHLSLSPVSQTGGGNLLTPTPEPLFLRVNIRAHEAPSVYPSHAKWRYTSVALFWTKRNSSQQQNGRIWILQIIYFELNTDVVFCCWSDRDQTAADDEDLLTDRNMWTETLGSTGIIKSCWETRQIGLHWLWVGNFQSRQGSLWCQLDRLCR